jgi:hypothetical protein
MENINTQKLSNGKVRSRRTNKEDAMDKFFTLIIPKREPRINGDTRHRKKRLFEKIRKLDEIKYAPIIKQISEEMMRKIRDKLELEIIQGPITLED